MRVQSVLQNLNTFDKGQWVVFKSQENAPESFDDNCQKLSNLFEDTDVCLKNIKYSRKYLKDSDFYVFIDNEGKPQIVCNFSKGTIDSFRGVCDEDEQTIDKNYIDVANEFLKAFDVLKGAKQWQYQTEWYVRLHDYKKLFESRQYDKIDVSQLIDDIGYNGYDLHYEGCLGVSKKRYYPRVKREIISQAMLKPLIAKHLDCQTNDIFIGKYQGNGKNVKYVIGDLISRFLDNDCKIEKVFGSVDIVDYHGDFTDFYKIDCSGSFKIFGSNSVPNLISGYLLKGAKQIKSKRDLNPEMGEE